MWEQIIKDALKGTLQEPLLRYMDDYKQEIADAEVMCAEDDETYTHYFDGVRDEEIVDDFLTYATISEEIA